MNMHVVICTFRPGTDMEDVFAVVAEEQAQVKVLQESGRLGAVHLSLTREPCSSRSWLTTPGRRRRR